MSLKLPAILLLIAAFVPAKASGLVVSGESLIGTWHCGPTAMKGPQFEMSVISETKRAADLTFVSTTTTVLMPDGKPSITITDSARGTWKLEEATLIWIYQETKFVSSSDRGLSGGLWQRILDDQLRKKSVYKSRILEINQTSMRSIPVDSDHPEAVVEAKCNRTQH